MSVSMKPIYEDAELGNLEFDYFWNNRVNEEIRQLAKAILAIIEEKKASIACARTVFRLCEDIIDHCTAVSVTQTESDELPQDSPSQKEG